MHNPKKNVIIQRNQMNVNDEHVCIFLALGALCRLFPVSNEFHGIPIWRFITAKNVSSSLLFLWVTHSLVPASSSDGFSYSYALCHFGAVSTPTPSSSSFVQFLFFLHSFQKLHHQSLTLTLLHSLSLIPCFEIILMSGTFIPYVIILSLLSTLITALRPVT